MKHISVFFNIFLAAILALIVMPNFNANASAPTQAESPAACDKDRAVQVSGTAIINVVPDRALIQLGVQSNGKTPSETENANTAAIQKIIKALKDTGIESKDIATDWYYVMPVYSDYDSLYIKGYRINNTVAVTVRDVKNISKIVSAALNAGANQIINVELYTSELRKYRDQARGLAVQAAKEKANLLANAAGAKTDCIMSVTENVWSYYNGWWGRDNSAIWSQNVMQNAAPSAGAGEGALAETGPLSLGQISVRAEVTTTFSLK